jgi:hypothetical protein
LAGCWQNRESEVWSPDGYCRPLFCLHGRPHEDRLFDRAQLMDPEQFDRLVNIGYEPRVLTRLANATNFVGFACGVTLICSTFGVAGAELHADPAPRHSPVNETSVLDRSESNDVVRLLRPELEQGEHPLVPVYRFAMQRYQYVRPRLRDFECQIVKRERFDGVMSDFEHIHMKIRTQQIRDNRVVVPYSVFIEWLGPEELTGRKVLYVAGWNDGKMRIRKGGGRFNYIKINLSPFSETVMQQSHYPITEAGIVRLAGRMVNQIVDDIRIDPQGVNTQAQFFKNAKVSGRACTRIEIVHPAPWPGLIFHRANLFIDNELHVPVRIEAYDWPDEETGETALIEEYTYLKLRLNVGLTDDDFDAAVVK